MATPRSSFFFSPRGDTLLYLIALLSLLLHHISADSHFEGFDADDDLEDDTVLFQPPLSDLPRRPPPPPTTLSTPSDPESHHGPPVPQSDPDLNPKTTSFDYWDEDEFEGFPVDNNNVITPPEVIKTTSDDSVLDENEKARVLEPVSLSKRIRAYTVEMICVSFLIMFAVNYFTGKKENENLALAWAAKFATKDTIFDKNFSLLGVGEGDNSPLLMKEGQNVFKFYASGRRYCQDLVATMELKSRQDLIAKLYNMVVPCKDEITIEVRMNEDAMDHVVFALGKKKAAKVMHKEVRDLQRFASLMTAGPNGRKWVADELMVITESKEVAGDLITETVLDQVS